MPSSQRFFFSVARRPFSEFLEKGSQLGLADLQADALHGFCMVDDVGWLASSSGSITCVWMVLLGVLVPLYI